MRHFQPKLDAGMGKLGNLRIAVFFLSNFVQPERVYLRFR